MTVVERNLLTRGVKLNALVGVEFLIGDVKRSEEHTSELQSLV